MTAAAALAASQHEPRILLDTGKKKYFFEQGPVKFEVYHDLWKTLGAGNFKSEGGAIDLISDTLFKRFAELNQLPAEPLFREILRPVLNGIIQTAFYRDVCGPNGEQAPYNSDVLESNQRARVAAALKGFEKLRGQNEAAGERLAKNPNRHVFTKQPEKVWRLTKKAEKLELKGQQLLIHEWFKKNHQGAKTAIATALESGGMKANQPIERVVAFYLAKWSKAGWLEVMAQAHEDAAVAKAVAIVNSSDEEVNAIEEGGAKELAKAAKTAKKKGGEKKGAKAKGKR